MMIEILLWVIIGLLWLLCAGVVVAINLPGNSPDTPTNNLGVMVFLLVFAPVVLICQIYGWVKEH